MIHLLLQWFWMLIGWVELGLFTLILFLLSFLPKPMLGNSYRQLFRFWSQLWTYALGVELRLHQQNSQPLPKHYLLIANHPSAFEDIGIPALFDVDCLAKQEVRHWFMVGRISAAAQTLFVERESRDSRQQASKAISQALGDGRNIALYPEGGVKSKHLHDHFRYGAFDISLQTGTPILPVFIHYEAQDDFYWSNQSLLMKLLQIMRSRNRRANYYVFDAFYPKDFDSKESYCEHVYQQYVSWQERYLK